MSAEICELNGQAGRTILRLYDWDDDSRRAVAQWKFHGVEPKTALGSFEPLAEFADRVHWLYYPEVESSAGLEKLKAVRRISFGDVLPQPKFDLRQLPALEVLQCQDASTLDKRHLNHPRLRYLDLEGLKAVDLTFLSEAQELAAMRLRRCALTSLKGSDALDKLQELRLLGAKKLEDVSDIGGARNLDILEIGEAKKLRDISAVHTLDKLRYLFIEADEATQSDLAWIANMPRLECAGLWLETRLADFALIAKHPRLYDIMFGTHAGFELPDDAVLIPLLQAHGKRVLKITRFPKALRPSIRIEFAPPSDLADAKPLPAYQTKLLADPDAG